MAEWLVRLLVGLTVAIVVAVARLLVGVVRLGLRLLGLAGFRGARLAALAATVAGVLWATATVGVGPAVRLVVIGWAVWATRHHRAAIRQHAAVRRLAAAQHAAVRRLTAALEQHTSALDAAARREQPDLTSSPTAAAPSRGTTGRPPWPRGDQTPDQLLGALGRYAAAWTRRHTPHPAAASSPPRPAVLDRRPPR
jgi:hypothetical protein